ncbi:PP2C family protein-serine/threonine phosphatase [Qipengyuania psychrotolerans]|uniref:Protein phosphatase 2C domain-containing protein n=1 Tax=Qipengyuania psychrotolerans TaxID=2867238 RepID=A0ABX8ZG66_9SPHN|nr:protein phosphatase 2C domain-containing protein [Qipengyuania psychrotolerans]
MTALRYWALSRCGLRAENQDACVAPGLGLVEENTVVHGAITLSWDGEVVAIADGVGGGPDGRLAAITALRTLTAHSVKRNDPLQLEKLLRTADLAVQGLKSSRGRPSTTIAGISTNADFTHIFNLGDTRVYDLSHEQRLLTEDHRSTMNRSAITRFLGGGPAQGVPRITTLATEARRLLICSDGLYNFVASSTLALLAERDPQGELPRIFDVAEALGSNDNLSAIVCEIS